MRTLVPFGNSKFAVAISSAQDGISLGCSFRFNLMKPEQATIAHDETRPAFLKPFLPSRRRGEPLQRTHPI
jgi:hypothetical protein